MFKLAKRFVFLMKKMKRNLSGLFNDDIAKLFLFLVVSDLETSMGRFSEDNTGNESLE